MFKLEILRVTYFVTVQTVDPAANNFLIGGPSRNRASADFIDISSFQSQMTGAEGIFIEIRGNKALISGSEGNFDDKERGTVYGV